MTTFKDLAQLGKLRQQLKEQEAERERAAIEKRRQEAEANVFLNSMQHVTPLHHGNRVMPHAPKPSATPRQRLMDEEAALRESLSDDFTPDTLLASDENLSYTRPGIGNDVLSRLRRGQWVIQRQLDLHGMRRDEARDALGLFLREAKKQGIRCVRIIHGKGHGSINKEPVLKHKVRNWLVQKEEVMAFCQARPADGGAGALIVLLASSM